MNEPTTGRGRHFAEHPHRGNTSNAADQITQHRGGPTERTTLPDPTNRLALMIRPA